MKALSLITLAALSLVLAGCHTHRGGSSDAGVTGMHYDRYDSRNVSDATVNDDLGNPPRRTAPLRAY